MLSIRMGSFLAYLTASLEGRGPPIIAQTTAWLGWSVDASCRYGPLFFDACMHALKEYIYLVALTPCYPPKLTDGSSTSASDGSWSPNLPPI